MKYFLGLLAAAAVVFALAYFGFVLKGYILVGVMCMVAMIVAVKMK
jgi:hypothetical protein